MERLTKIETTVVEGKELVLCNCEEKDCNDSCKYGFCKWSYKAMAKLKAYEDAEEQGLLVKIECHCKDCKHVDFAGCNNGTCYCYMNECYMNEDDFCKYAERYKEEAEQKLESMKGE